MEFEIIEYKEEYGPILWQDGFQEELEGKSFEEQIRCYAWTKSYCYDSTSDNNGAGYKEHSWYKYLICLPADHTLW